MNDYWWIYLFLGGSLLLLTFKFIRGGLRDLITPLCLFYFYFAFGPVINYLLGYPIYFGIPKDYIPQTTSIFFTALAAFVLPSLFWKQKELTEVKYNLIHLPALVPFYIFSVCYALYVVTMVLLSGASDKVAKIGIAIPALHYNYLLLQLYLISFYFLVKDSRLGKLYFLNTLVYILYSLVIGERDFIFPVISIIFHNFIFQKKGSRSNVKLIASMLGLLLVATLVFLVRDATQSSENVMAAILNQGSLLFVNSFSLKLLAERIDFFFGYTFFNSFLNLLPNWIYKTDFNTLEWFKNSYAAASTSGYGFGLDAEGYLNFSYFGVFLSFFGILFLQRKISTHFNSHPFFTFFSVFYTGFTMYCLRNDSLAYFKGNLYAVIFFFLIYKISSFRNWSK